MAFSLLQSWVFAHFPGSLFERRDNPAYTPDRPVALTWEALRGTTEVAQKRMNLDTFPASSVIWRPYVEHYAHWPFPQVALYRGFIRHAGMIFPYLPDRVIRQFGRIQYVPDPPPSSVTCRECDRRFAHWNDHICHLSEEAAFPFQTTGEYTPWYIKVSHPYMVPDEYKADRFAFLEVLTLVFAMWLTLRLCVCLCVY